MYSLLSAKMTCTLGSSMCILKFYVAYIAFFLAYEVQNELEKSENKVAVSKSQSLAVGNHKFTVFLCCLYGRLSEATLQSVLLHRKRRV